jgi:hypothetical protein
MVKDVVLNMKVLGQPGTYCSLKEIGIIDGTLTCMSDYRRGFG